MVQFVENRSLLRCTLLADPQDGPAAGWWSCRVRVEETSGVPGWEHLLGDATGRELDAIVPPEVVRELEGLTLWSLTVELVGPHRIRVQSLG